jgi:hypothetical protein
MRGVALFCFLMILLLPAVAQQVNGHWYGVGKVQYPRQSNSYLSELVLRQQGTRVWGDFIYYFKDSILQVPIRGRYNNTTRSIRSIQNRVLSSRHAFQYTCLPIHGSGHQF